MKNHEKSDKKLEDLRLRAEKAVQASEKLAPAADTDLRRMVHELHVHRIELELQNEELQQSRLALEKSHTQYVGLYNYSPIPYFTLDSESYIIKYNLAAVQFLACEDKIYSKHLIHFIATHDKSKYTGFIDKIIESSSKQTVQLDMLTKTGEKRIVQLQGIPSTLMEEGGYPSFQIQLAIIDLTDLKKAETESLINQRFRHIIEGIPGMYLFLAPDYSILEVSNDYLKVFQLERSQITGYTVAEIFANPSSHNYFTATLMQSLLQVSKSTELNYNK
jgi:PAS domain-containing protein